MSKDSSTASEQERSWCEVNPKNLAGESEVGAKRRHRTAGEAQGLQECLAQTQGGKVGLRSPLEGGGVLRERTNSVPWMSPGSAWRV